MKKYIDSGKIDTRSGFGVGLYEAGKADPRVVALTADLKGSLKMDQFAAEFPDRFIQCGIAESNMVGAAAGLAVTGKIPFIGSFAEFVSGRVYDQVRQEVGYGHTNVKIASSHAGITLGEDGATHQTMEDIALMRAIPGMVVINPCDFNQTKQATIAAAKYDGPVYLRFGRPSWPNFTPDEPFEIGKAYIMNEGSDVTIIACGHLVWESIKAAEALEAEGISAEVINIATIKPLDEAAVLASALKTKAVVVAEEHNSAGGIGELVAGVLAKSAPTPMEFLNGEDKWGQSGTPAELLAAYGLDAAHIVLAAKKAIARK
ncbi:MAG: transketolase family protein [Bacteroidales bacterium]|jgi:transketolase|nr:transketolase family protein [Bacteroidales bacterium]MBQ2104293.1 transketolase family protein [Bacteroidales bacterium]MBQ2502190.1 transketolase family protein [Bacteroidales bacterium]MBQ3984425.1 transketolase family protein [Bacteroidales bacterium]MBQ4168244.1 transketolase family protein [Bacteroidales bacterium]